MRPILMLVLGREPRCDVQPQQQQSTDDCTRNPRATANTSIGVLTDGENTHTKVTLTTGFHRLPHIRKIIPRICPCSYATLS